MADGIDVPGFGQQDLHVLLLAQHPADREAMSSGDSAAVATWYSKG
jgi:hypothetical protein